MSLFANKINFGIPLIIRILVTRFLFFLEWLINRPYLPLSYVASMLKVNLIIYILLLDVFFIPKLVTFVLEVEHVGPVTNYKMKFNLIKKEEKNTQLMGPFCKNPPFLWLSDYLIVLQNTHRHIHLV